jgi:phosphopantetheine--protein transferase-like protein
MTSVFSSITSELEKRGIAFSAVDIASVSSWSDGEGERMYHSFLSQSEISCMAAMKIVKRRMDFISGRIAGKRALRRLMDAGGGAHKEKSPGDLGYPGIEIRRTRTGAPRVFFNDTPARVRVSISHSPLFAASAACGGEDYRGIGIDLEIIEPRDESLMNVAFRETEISAMRERAEKKCANIDAEVTRYWSLKEAALKSMGAGLNFDLKDIEIVERGDGAVQLLLENGVKERFERLGSQRIDVTSYPINGHVLSVACLH